VTTQKNDGRAKNDMPQEITRLQAVDSDGRTYVILEITPVEKVQTFHGVRKEYGRVRHELNDGTAVVRVSDTRFRVEVSGTMLEVVQP
jgi:hypothetical protein